MANSARWLRIGQLLIAVLALALFLVGAILVPGSHRAFEIGAVLVLVVAEGLGILRHRAAHSGTPYNFSRLGFRLAALALFIVAVLVWS